MQVVCDRAGIDVGDRLAKNSRKRKWLVVGIDQTAFAPYEEFDVVHDYLVASNDKVQVRVTCYIL